MITHRVSFILLAGSPVMKSIDMEFHGLSGGSMVFKSPNGTCLTGLIRRHVVVVDVLVDVSSLLWPVEIPANEFQVPCSAQVSRGLRVMVVS